MTEKTKTIAAIVVAAYFCVSLPSFANGLINNSAVGIVQGSIHQEGDSSINVGAITYQYGDVQSVSVSAVVKGDIVASAGTKMSIGSYHGK